jgi:anti-sigma B factor antagonist
MPPWSLQVLFPAVFGKPMQATPGFEDVADRFRSSRAGRPERPSRAAKARTGAPPGTRAAFEVRWLPPAHERDQDAAVLSVRGEIDLLTAPVLCEAAQPVLKRGTRAVVADLSEVPFMDSTGVHALVDMLQRLSAQNRRFAIVCRGHGQVHRLLALVGLLDAVTVLEGSSRWVEDERPTGRSLRLVPSPRGG